MKLEARRTLVLMVVGVFAVSTKLDLTAADEPASIFCDENRCENNGTCITVSHPYGGIPTLCDAQICYKTMINATDWEGALTSCSQMNGNLLALDEQKELEKLYKHLIGIHDILESIPDGGHLEFWTSGNDLAYEDIWVWAFTKTHVSTYNVTERDNSRQNCLALAFGTGDAALRPELCSEKKFFICEVPEQFLTEERTYQCICPDNFVGQRCEIKEVSSVCEEMACPNEEKCFKRIGDPNFVCECTELETMGHDCTETWAEVSSDKRQRTCYGHHCYRSAYFSDGYPGRYPDRLKELYLIYIPGAEKIEFFIDELDLEQKGEGLPADILLLGPGLVKEKNESQFMVTETGVITVEGDSAWIYFSTDRSTPDGKRGFHLSWFSEVDRTVAVDNLLQSKNNISCPESTVIFIECAAYGKLSSDLISKGEFCLDTASLYKAAHRCNGLTYCDLPVDVDFTFDPCPEVNKTLDIRYRCVSEGSILEYERITTVPDSSSENRSCAVDRLSKLQKDYIEVGIYDIQQCPDNQDGIAFQDCNGTFGMVAKDVSLCKSQWIDQTLSQIAEGEVSAIEIAKAVNNITVDSLDGAIQEHDTKGATRDLVQTVRVLDDLIELQSRQLEDKPREEREDVVKQFSEAFLQIGSNLLDLKRKDIWVKAQEEGDELSEGDSLSPTSVTEDLESTAFLLASQLSEKSNEAVLVSENIVMGVEVVPGSSDKAIAFSFDDFVEGDNNITLSTSATGQSSSTSNSKKQMVFFLYKTLGDLFPTNQENLNIEEGDTTRDTTSEGAYTTIAPETNTTRNINSLVISASVNLKTTGGNESEPDFNSEVENVEVEFTLEHTNSNVSGDVSCVFWRYKDPHQTGHWSTEGCRVVTSTETHTTCACTHLTNFAILVDVKGSHKKISSEHELALKWITIIGCSISIVCLGMCIFSFTFFKSLRNVRTMIHRNLCISLMCAELLFIFGVDKTQEKIVCAVIAGVLHYSFLAAFFWMFLEAVQFYIMLVLVFSNEPKYWVYYLVGYGLPLVIVGATAGSKHDGYGTDKFCWLTTEDGMIWSFAGPLAAIVAANFALLLVSLYKAYSARARVSKDASSSQNLMPWIKGALTMLFLLGCTWGIGFFFLSTQSLFMAYLFTILNSSQGMFIFIFYCLGNERVVTEVRKLIGRQKWLPLWFRERYGPKQKILTSTTHTDIKQKRAIPSVTLSDGVGNPVYLSTPVPQRSWLYSMSGTNTLASEMSYETPYPEPDYM